MSEYLGVQYEHEDPNESALSEVHASVNVERLADIPPDLLDQLNCTRRGASNDRTDRSQRPQARRRVMGARQELPIRRSPRATSSTRSRTGMTREASRCLSERNRTVS
jgi:hypothetical protein